MKSSGIPCPVRQLRRANLRHRPDDPTIAGVQIPGIVGSSVVFIHGRPSNTASNLRR
jgi:hypothetical protein